MVAKNHLKLNERIRIHEYLKTQIEVLGEGECRYKHAGVDDKTVAAVLGGAVNPRNVAGVRREMFGDLPTGGARVPGGLESRVAALEADLARLKAALGPY